MNLSALVTSFGRGVTDAYMGALPVFILADVIAIAGAVVAMTGGTDMTVGFIAFSSYLGPHIAFAGGAAVSAYIGKAKKLGSGADILSCFNGLVDPVTLLVDDVLGVIGFLVHYVIGAVLHLNTDLPGLTVIISAVITRLIFGFNDPIGKAAPDEMREYFTGRRGMLCNMILGLGIGTTARFVYQALVDGGASATSIGNYPVLCFGITAVPPTFAQTEFVTPAIHHITPVSALAAITTQSPVIGIVLGILTSLFGDLIGETLNSCCDTYIDPPAFIIFIFTFIVNVLFGSGFFGA